ncbi:hypothetical protein MSP8887_00585 [Marinomonas spartinae]|uniref:PIN-like domain-containing protein n=1 Tax=Marinomonas spartinae TaxID=1792290 RepID=UPI000808A309|nr:PIN-like domain-containing protein [Marinomonas spartinae]SBS27245.1 hypothetical protein MSP8887_00585 [Marinomonas spartinae]
MKEKFPGYIDDYLETNVLVENKILVAFDTNVLLNLYRYEKTIVDDIVQLMRSLKENRHFEVWLPHQVALEFNFNRKSVIRNQERSVYIIENKFKSFKKDLEGVSKIGGKKSELFSLKSELSQDFESINEIIKSHLPKKSSSNKVDVVIKKIYDLFDGNVGDSYNSSVMEEIELEGEYRYKHGIPPGFEDDSKSTIYSYSGIKVNAKYGDLILWKQLIDKAKEDDISVVFVSGDVKGDWQCKDFLRVKPELITEFKLKTKKEFYALTLTDFQRFFYDKLNYKLSKETTEEIKELTKSDSVGWLDEVLSAFYYFNRSLTLKEIYEYIAINSDRDFPPSWDSIIRRTIYNHCSDLKAYLGKNDYFRKLESGKYELRGDRKNNK